MLSVFFYVSICFAQKIDKDLQEFAQDLSSINVKIRGDLMLFGKYKGNLTEMTYGAYIQMLKKSEMKSNKGISEIINKADKKYFQSKSNTFIIVIYSKKMNAIICDNANTAFIDFVKVLGPDENIPDLKSFVEKDI